MSRAIRDGPVASARSVTVPESATKGAAPRLIFGRPDWLPLTLIAGDAIFVAASIVLAYWYRYYLDRIPRAYREPLAFGPYLRAIPAVVALYLFALAVNQQYRSWRGRTLVDQLFALYSGVALAGMLILATMALTHQEAPYSRLTFVYTILLSAVLMTSERYVLRQYETRLRRQGIGTERVLMVGTGLGSQMLIERMTMFPQYGYHVCGVVDDHLPVGAPFAGASVVGGIDELPRLIRDLRIDQMFLAMPGASHEELVHLITMCEDQRVEFKIVPDLLEVMSTRVAADAIDGLPLVGIRRSRLRGGAALGKRLIDIVLSAVALLLTAPLLVAIALGIKVMAPGPVLFRQERIGIRRQPFTLYKFRSMIVDAEAETGPVVAKPGDHRVTRLGRFLRRFSLDELPQLYNVLRGDMSLVGPRPQPTFFDARYGGEVPRYLERHQVRPGLTGWAEVNDLRGAAPIADRALYDAYYVENWSLALDLKIVLLTTGRIFFQRHAY
jgi:exopolysaccharide biosynthesis polyprenyl glycosylphosphotransferase